MASASATTYVAKVDSATGACAWSRTFPATDKLTITPLSTGEPLLQGTSSSSSPNAGCGPIAGTSGTYLAKLNASGACVWSKGLGKGFTVVPFPSDDIGLAGTYQGTLDLGCGPLTSLGTPDLVVARLNGSTGACTWSKSFGAAGAGIDPNLRFAVSRSLGYPVVYDSLGGSPVDFGGGPIANIGFFLELDGAGSFRAQGTFYDAKYFALDPCGAPIVVRACDTCGPSSNRGATVTKYAP
jgi:hypothetical protein